MTQKTAKRDEVIDEELYLELREYVTFRHFYRHAYSFQLNWEKMKPLVHNVKSIWERVKKRIKSVI